MRTALILLAMVLTLGTLIWALQRRLIYFPFGQVPDPAAVGLPHATAVSLRTADGLRLGGWLVGQPATAGATVIVFNGNAGNRAFRGPLARALSRHDIAVLLFDYRGFGGNLGSPSERGLRADARAAREYIVAHGVDSRRVAYFGESLGAAVAAELASEHPPAALILRSPFTSLTDVGQLHYAWLPVRWLLRDRYATIDLLHRVRVPLLVIAGDRDSIIPVAQSRRIFERANEPKSLLIVAGADHNDDALLAGREMIERIVNFLKSRGPA